MTRQSVLVHDFHPPSIVMEYFPARVRRHQSPSTGRTAQATANEPSHSPRHSDDSSLEQSIYIFPNPLSAPPSPNTAALTPDVRQVLIAYTPEPSRSRSVSVVTESTGTGWDGARSPFDSTASGADDLDAGVWEWPALSEVSVDQNELVLEEDIVGPSRWDLIASRRTPPHTSNSPLVPLAIRVRRYTTQQLPARPLSWIRSRTQSAASSLSSVIVIPHPRIRIPLLSFFSALLGVDESTLDLIEHTPSHSVLFSGYTPDGIDLSTDECSTEHEHPHGVLALVSREPDMLREGLRVSYEMPVETPHAFSFGSLPSFHGILNTMVNGIWSSGRIVLQEVL